MKWLVLALFLTGTSVAFADSQQTGVWLTDRITGTNFEIPTNVRVVVSNCDIKFPFIYLESNANVEMTGVDQTKRLRVQCGGTNITIRLKNLTLTCPHDTGLISLNKRTHAEASVVCEGKVVLNAYSDYQKIPAINCPQGTTLRLSGTRSLADRGIVPSDEEDLMGVPRKLTLNSDSMKTPDLCMYVGKSCVALGCNISGDACGDITIDNLNVDLFRFKSDDSDTAPVIGCLSSEKDVLRKCGQIVFLNHPVFHWVGSKTKPFVCSPRPHNLYGRPLTPFFFSDSNYYAYLFWTFGTVEVNETPVTFRHSGVQ